MNGQISTSFPATNWFYVGQDEHIHGPHASAAMLKWAHVGYFTDHLMLRTEKDECWYPLQEWVRACGNQLPFLLPIESMDSLRGANHGGSREQIMIYSPPPPATMVQPNGAPHLQQHQQPAYISYPNPIPFIDRQQHGMVQHHVPMSGNYAPFATLPPPQALHPTMGHIQEPFRTVHSNGVADAEGSAGADSTASITPEETEQLNYAVRASFPVCNKFIDTSDSPWNIKINRATDPILFLGQCSQATQTDDILLPQVQVERLLSDLLGLNISIVPVKQP